MGVIKDITGLKVGRLTVINLHGKTERKRCLWNCLCECGNYKIVSTSSLKSKSVKSCGCMIKGETKVNGYKPKHRGAGTKLYACWISIKHRCSNPKFAAYKHYGGKGITICKEWEFDFKAFMDWSLSNGYSPELTIDRKDSSGNYTPDNCRWATWIEQANNRSTNRFHEINGEKLTIRQISNKYNLPFELIRDRVNKGIKGLDIIK